MAQPATIVLQKFANNACFFAKSYNQRPTRCTVSRQPPC